MRFKLRNLRSLGREARYGLTALLTFELPKISSLFRVPGASKKTFRGRIAKGGRVNVEVMRSSERLLKDLFNRLTWLVQFNLTVENFLFSHFRQVRFSSCLCLDELTEIPPKAAGLVEEFLPNRSLSRKVLLVLNSFQSALFAEGRNPLGDRLRPKNM